MSSIVLTANFSVATGETWKPSAGGRHAWSRFPLTLLLPPLLLHLPLPLNALMILIQMKFRQEIFDI